MQPFRESLKKKRKTERISAVLIGGSGQGTKLKDWGKVRNATVKWPALMVRPHSIFENEYFSMQKKGRRGGERRASRNHTGRKSKREVAKKFLGPWQVEEAL